MLAKSQGSAGSTNSIVHRRRNELHRSTPILSRATTVEQKTTNALQPPSRDPITMSQTVAEIDFCMRSNLNVGAGIKHDGLASLRYMHCAKRATLAIVTAACCAEIWQTNRFTGVLRCGLVEPSQQCCAESGALCAEEPAGNAAQPAAVRPGTTPPPGSAASARPKRAGLNS